MVYDGNGNILSYTRNGTTAGGRSLAMDNLSYSYNRVNGYLQNNRLMQIADGVTTQTRLPGDPQDLVGQPAGNYSYDNIGNLIGNNPSNSIGDNIPRLH